MIELKYDLIIAGGGTAGAAAAVTAARKGCKVLLVEEQNCLGGISTSGMVPEWFSFTDGMGNILNKIKEELTAYGVLQGLLKAPDDKRFFNNETLKCIWQYLADEAGVDILYHTTLESAEIKDNRIKSVRLISCSQPIKATAPVFIDSTGEGDLSVLANAGYEIGSKDTNLVLHMSLIFWLFDTKAEVIPYLPKGIAPISSEEELPGLHVSEPLQDGRIFCNMTKIINHDPTDPVSLSRAESEARIQIIRILHFLQSTKFKRYQLASSGAKIGIREGRRIKGDFMLEESHITGRQTPLDFKDGITVATSQIDFHSLDGKGHSGRREKILPYSIPYRCITAAGIENLLLAGKCISVDQVVLSSCRMIPTCCSLGQAAGTAAVLALVNRGRIREIPITALRQILEKDGIVLNPLLHKSFHVPE